MQLSLRLSVSCSLVALLGACGSAPNPKPIAPTASQAPALQQPPPVPELSPVSAPKGLIGVGRLSRPGDLTKALAGWVGLPFEPKMVDALQPGLSAALAFDAPVEFAVVLPEDGSSGAVKAELVVSVGLRSVEQARSLLEEYLGQKLVELRPSLYVTPADAKYHCAIAASLGKSSSRFVCADKPASLEHLLPYATRGLPLENLGTSDLRMELRFEPLRQQFGAALRMGRTMAVPALLKELSLADARFDRPLADAAHAFGDELLDLFDDLDRLAVDFVVPAKSDQLETKVTLDFKGRTSLVSKVTADLQHRMTAPPSQYFDLPDDAAAAGYGLAGNPKLCEKMRALLGGLVEGLLAHFEVAAPLRRDVRAAVDTAFSATAPVVIGRGAVPSTVEIGKLSASDRLSLALGWGVWGLEAPAAPYKDGLKAIARLSGDQAFRKGLDTLADQNRGAAAASKPKAQAGLLPKSRLADWVRVKSHAVAAMPAGSEVVLIEFNQDATKQLWSGMRRKMRKGKKLDTAAAESVAGLFAVVPDGTRTWFVSAMDDKTLRERAKSVLSTGKASRLATRTDLSPLRGQVAAQAGFSSLLAAKGWVQLALFEQGKSAKDVEALISALPHHAATPILYRTILSGDDKRHTLELSTTIPRAVFEDIAAAVPTAMMLSAD